MPRIGERRKKRNNKKHTFLTGVEEEPLLDQATGPDAHYDPANYLANASDAEPSRERQFD